MALAGLALDWPVRRRWSGTMVGWRASVGRLVVNEGLWFRHSEFAPPSTRLPITELGPFPLLSLFLFSLSLPLSSFTTATTPLKHPEHPAAMGCTQSSIVDDEAKARKSPSDDAITKDFETDLFSRQ